MSNTSCPHHQIRPPEALITSRPQQHVPWYQQLCTIIRKVIKSNTIQTVVACAVCLYFFITDILRSCIIPSRIAYTFGSCHKPPEDCSVLKTTNYKVRGDFGIHPDSISRTNMVLDTDAVPNIIRTDMLPNNFCEHIEEGPTVRIRAANGKCLETRGLIKLWIRLEKLITQEKFL